MSFMRFGLLVALLGATACVSSSNDNYRLPVNGVITEAPAAGGILIETDGPSRVHAAMTGRVISVKRAPDGTKTMVMDHGGGMRTEYAQLTRVTAARGEDLRKGHTIGWVGRRGAETAEVRFQMRVGNANVDPTQVVDMGEAASSYGAVASAQ